MSSKIVKVALFCGGRGSSTIARELARRPEVQLSLMINAYDDGLSTGALRGLVPGMLGASDFRKNISSLMDLHSTAQYELRALLEYRLPPESAAQEVDALRLYLQNTPDSPTSFGLLRLFDSISPTTLTSLSKYALRFFEYQDSLGAPFDFADCSIGNIIFAGAYLECHSDFNRSIQALAELFGSAVKIVNVTQGESRTLAALKADGELLSHESAVVSSQSSTRIVDLFLLENPLSLDDQKLVEQLPLEEKREFLKTRERPVYICPQADTILREADLIIYGCGTQHSSLLPSYMTAGLPEAIQQGKARAKVFIANLQPDHDIQGWTASELLQAALRTLNDPDNQKSSITHLFYAEPTSGPRLPLGELFIDRVSLVTGPFTNPVRPGIHSGLATVKKAISLLETPGGALPSLDIYVDLHNRSNGIASLQQEFLEQPWHERFSRVRLLLNSAERLEPLPQLPDHLSIEYTQHHGLFSGAPAVRDWLREDTVEYLLTLTGDGEYVLHDAFLAHQVLRDGPFGAVFGSRTQSRRQVRSSLLAAYGESPALYWVSWLGSYVISLVFGLLFRVIFTDPMTGFRLYRRDCFQGQVKEQILSSALMADSSLIRYMKTHGVEAAEVPVRYRTFRGFTQPRWRLMRGLRNLIGGFVR